MFLKKIVSMNEDLHRYIWLFNFGPYFNTYLASLILASKSVGMSQSIKVADRARVTVLT